MTSTFGRADLLRAYLTGGEAALRDVAGRLGMEEDLGDAARALRVVPDAVESEIFSDMAWDDDAFAVDDDVALEVDVLRAPAQFMANAEPWRRVERRLTAGLARGERAEDGDTAHLTEAAARLRPVESMRRRVVESWPRELLLVVDFNDRLAPLRRDQVRLIELLARRLGRTGLAVERSSTEGASLVGRVSPGSAVLALTGWHDAATGTARMRAMVERRTGLRGRRLVALGAGPDLGDEHAGVTIVPWARAPATDVERAIAAWAFELVLAVPAFVEPGLLRDLRIASALPGADLATELATWAHFEHQQGRGGRHDLPRRAAIVADLRAALAAHDGAIANFAAHSPVLTPDDPAERAALAAATSDALRSTLGCLLTVLPRWRAAAARPYLHEDTLSIDALFPSGDDTNPVTDVARRDARVFIEGSAAAKIPAIVSWLDGFRTRAHEGFADERYDFLRRVWQRVDKA